MANHHDVVINLVVIGGSVTAAMLHPAALLRRRIDSVTFCQNDIDASTDDCVRLLAFGVRIVDGLVTRLENERGKLVIVEFTDGSWIGYDAAFVASRPRPKGTVLRALGCAVSSATGWATLDQTGVTGAPGVRACGNVVNPRAEIVTAAGEGGTAAMATTDWLLDRDVAAAVKARR